MSRRAGSPPSAADPYVAAVARFHNDLSPLLPAPDATLLLAVSGGADSMAMLTLAAGALPTDRIAAATVDHGLRAEAAEEARLVADYCATLGVSHATLTPADAIAGASIQAQARIARYALLADHAATIGAGAIATAHHIDDQAETFLMRASRGSGLSGLAGVRAVTDIAGARIVRPLLDWRRVELRAIVRRRDVPFVEDPSNRNPAHDRTRYRQLLNSNEWLGPAQIARSAAALAEADADLRGVVEWLWQARARARTGDSGVDLDVADLPRELLRRLARRGVIAVREAAGIAEPAFGEATNVEPLLDALAAGRRASQSGVTIAPHRSGWRFRPAPPRRAH